MTESEIIEGNRLIAEFMGCKIEYVESIQEDWVYIESGNCRVSHLQYHKSFDWLIPVIKKLRNQNLIINNSALSQVNESGKVVRTLIKLMDIEQVWQATVDYIKWYNSVKTK